MEVHDTVVAAVIKKFAERSELGQKKYGTTLDRTDLGTLDWIIHAQEEFMDGILYLEKLKQSFPHVTAAAPNEIVDGSGSGSGSSSDDHKSEPESSGDSDGGPTEALQSPVVYPTFTATVVKRPRDTDFEVAEPYKKRTKSAHSVETGSHVSPVTDSGSSSVGNPKRRVNAVLYGEKYVNSK